MGMRLIGIDRMLKSDEVERYSLVARVENRFDDISPESKDQSNHNHLTAYSRRL